jgi:hypothetical protein
MDALSPLSLTIPTAALPDAVAMAAMVSEGECKNPVFLLRLGVSGR